MPDQGRSYLAIPGPSVIPDRVLRAMMRPAPNIYGGPLHEMVEGLIERLRTVARTRHEAVIYIGNGHAGWEAALANVVRPGDRVLVPAAGRFGHGWAATARAMGIEAEVIEHGMGGPIDPGRVEAALRADREGTIRAVLAVHVDTSTGARSDVAAIRAAIDAAGHPALLMADCVASLGCDRFEMDAWGVDVTLAASQKGLMCPAGLFFLWFNDRAAEARGRAAPGPYWDWRPRAAPQIFYERFAGTAPTHGLFALDEALSMIEEEGLETIWARHATLARAVWAACDAWGPPVALNVADPAHRSHAVTALSVGAPHGRELRAWVEGCGVTLGVPLGHEPPDGHLRIGHMGHVNAHMVLGVLGVMEAGLGALGFSHGPGVAAAARVVAG